ncbi:MAG: glutamate-1-semialdehyde-2,1-aminomutase [Clostridiales bacterium]|nr:MAG: glutamate-1-semialdehyde-2,1-aminomutase [Clostridiales bacterium]HJA31808.1 glutamate-1-semialdehyde 2,1-aminomutase [Candidatus Eisenbergiella pullicola]
MNSRSEQLFEKASRLMPGGVNSPVRAFGAVGGHPFFVQRAQGPWLYDEDGRRYLDYVCSWGPCILGHACPPVIEAVQRACADGLTFGAPTEKEAVLAEMISACVPDVEMVRLVSSGTEAVMSAVRVARGFTGREKIIKFEGNYHGHSDGLLVKAGSGMMTQSVPDSAGVPAGYAKTTLTAVYNDSESVRRLMEENRGEVAAVVVEPVAANMGVVLPKPGFLEFLRRITEENGALLIFDEVITGFRLGLGGATEYTGVHADLHTFGKIVGGGMPLAAYGGSGKIMSCVAPLGPVYQAGTLSGNPVAVTAGIETLKILMDRPQLYLELEEKAARLENAFLKKGLTVNRAGSLLTPFFLGGEKAENYGDVLKSDRKAFSAYFAWMLSRNIYVAPSPFEAMFVSAAHTDELIAETCRAIGEWQA